ncbi:MAG: methyltransferase domain-containing protein [Burkholderiaceae bacterium]|nr:methyltransferase domain-containing protein [Burkholderiaceae bacterium]
MKTLNRVVIGLSMAMLALSAGHAQSDSSYGDDKYRPSVGQEGKDVIWVPTNGELVGKMLEAAKVTSSDIVYDLGAGDGNIPITAAKKYGVRAVGIEFNADMAALARRNAQRAGVADRVKIINGDIFQENFSEATVVTLYLLPDLNLKLRPTILKMKPGTRVVSHAFDMGDWEPDQRIESSRANAFLWVVPADVAGEWALDGVEIHQKVSLQLSQRYQRIGGNIVIGKSIQPILGAQIEGDRLSFRYLDAKGVLHHIKAVVRGSTLEGEHQTGSTYSPLKGTRR